MITSKFKPALFCALLPVLLLLLLLASCAPTRNLSMFSLTNTQCYDRQSQPSTFVVDSHNHFRPFGSQAIEYKKLIGYFKKLGILFVNAYGIGQSLPKNADCQYFTDCPGAPVRPSISNDLVNAQNYLKFGSNGVQIALSMSFADLANPQNIAAQITQLTKDYPGLFKWMGEVNLVKQALFDHHHKPTPVEKIAQWQDFMTILRRRNIPIAIHADLGNDQSPTQYLYLMDEVLKQYPNNKIIWVHMGLSRQLTKMDPVKHINIIKARLDNHPNLMIDIAWRVLYEHYFSHPQIRQLYVEFFNQYSKRILPGSDFVGTAVKNFVSYKTDVQINSEINQYLNNQAFINIVLGQNYFDLLQLPFRAPDICQ